MTASTPPPKRPRSSALVTKTVHAIDFTRVSGTEFERLVLAFAVRRWPWETIEWYGQVGDDGGRDLHGTRPGDDGRPEAVVIACANWAKLSATKGKGDIKKIARGAAGVPDRLLLVAGGSVAASVRTSIVAAAKAAKISAAEVWSGPEFEEQLRLHAEPVLARFLAGDVLPDDPDAARALDRVGAGVETASLALLRGVFERPAFETPFHAESNLGHFRRALGDVIAALNTGIVRDRDSAIVHRMPSRFAYESTRTREVLADLARQVDDLRAALEVQIRDGKIRVCGCGQADCPTFMVDRSAAAELDQRRRQILDHVSRIVGARVGRAP